MAARVKTAGDVLRWAQSHLESVRHDLGLLDRGLDPHAPDQTKGFWPWGEVGEVRRSREHLAIRLRGQEFVLERLVQDLTGVRPSERTVLPEWKPRESSPGMIDWEREGVRLRDEQGRPHSERWAITAPLPDGRRVTTNYATTLAEAMQKGDEDVEVIRTDVLGVAMEKAGREIPKKEDLYKNESDATVETRRGHTDAVAGHGPALFDGPCMVGYRRGRAEIGRPMEHKPASEDA